MYKRLYCKALILKSQIVKHDPEIPTSLQISLLQCFCMGSFLLGVKIITSYAIKTRLDN